MRSRTRPHPHPRLPILPLLENGLESLLGNPPRIVAADLDDDDGRLLDEHILVQPLEQIGHRVPAGGDGADLNFEVGMRLFERVADDGDVAFGALRERGERVAEEEDVVGFLEGGESGGGVGAGGQNAVG